MKKLMLLLLITAMIFPSALAQDRDVQPLEGSISISQTYPFGGYHGGEAKAFYGVGFEGRYNFKDSPWDCGLKLDISTAAWNFGHVISADPTFIAYAKQINRTIMLSAVADYNFRQGKKANPFAGVGLGAGFNKATGEVVVVDGLLYPHSGTSLAISPRAGVELFHFLRLQCEMNICRKGYSNVCLSAGFTLGGRPRK